jgi:hypothetical protein
MCYGIAGLVEKARLRSFHGVFDWTLFQHIQHGPFLRSGHLTAQRCLPLPDASRWSNLATLAEYSFTHQAKVLKSIEHEAAMTFELGPGADV